MEPQQQQQPAILLAEIDSVRRMSSSKRTDSMTMTTSASTASPSPGCESPQSKVHRLSAREQVLVGMIAKEMATSLIHQGRVGDETEPASPSSTTDSAALNIDVSAIAEMVMSSVDKTSRTGPSQNETESSTRRTTSASEMSLTQHAADTPMDIWHPEFWNAFEAGEIDEAVKSLASAKKSEGKSSDEIATGGDMTPDDTDNNVGALSVPSMPSGGHFSCITLKQKSPGSELESGSDDSDNDSVVSDLTGLTGCFSEYYDNDETEEEEEEEPLKERQQALPRMQSQRSTLTRRSSLKAESTGINSRNSRGAGQRSTICSTGRGVTFGRVHVRFYERALSDNPASKDGLSIGIGWQYSERPSKSVDLVERSRTRPPRKATQLVLNRRQREKVIRRLGYSDKEIVAATRDINKARHQRMQTINNLGAQRMEEAVQSVKRKMVRMLTLQRKQKSATEADRLEI